MSLESIILVEIVASPAWIAGGHEGTPSFEHEVGNCWVASPAEEVLQFCSVRCSLIFGPNNFLFKYLIIYISSIGPTT
jgi:hypothetical protein